jgi:hypothetical protein
MHGGQPEKDVTAKGDERISADGGGTGPPRLSRRQAMGHMSVVTAVGAVAWAVPEILTAKAAGGATLSSPGVVTGASTLADSSGEPSSKPAATPPGSLASTLAFTGLNIQRDAEVGAAMIAGGWAMQHWASRAPKPAGSGPSEAHQADRTAD